MNNHSDSKKRNIPTVIFVCLILLGAFGTLFILLGSFSIPSDDVYLSYGWDLYIGDDYYEDVNPDGISELTGLTMQPMDEIYIERDMSDITESFDNPALKLSLYYTAATVYIDGEEIKSLQYERLGEGRFIGCGIYYAELPDDYAGHTLGIKYVFTESDSSANLTVPVLASYDTLIKQFIREHSLTLACAVFMMVFGLIFMLFSIPFKSFLPGLNGQVVSSVVCMDIGLYTLSSFDLLRLFIDTPYMTEIEYFTLYLLMPLLSLLIYQIQELPHKKIFAGIIIFSFAFVAFATVMHMLDIAHYPKLRTFFFCLVGFTLTELIVLDIQSIVHKKTDALTLLQLGGVTALVICGAIAVILYAVTSFSEHAWQSELPMIMGSLGGYLFTIFRFMIYLIITKKMQPKYSEFMSLSKAVYTDTLTGLDNRAALSDEMEELPDVKKAYCVVSLDVNNLKITNDTHGHAAGDRLLKSFAQALRKSFPPEAMCYRIGGDEFMVTWKGTDQSAVDKCLDALKDELEKMNAKDTKINHSAAWGYAFSYEFENPDPHSVYMKADERMYAAKALYKKSVAEKKQDSGA